MSYWILLKQSTRWLSNKNLKTKVIRSLPISEQLIEQSCLQWFGCFVLSWKIKTIAEIYVHVFKSRIIKQLSKKVGR